MHRTGWPSKTFGLVQWRRRYLLAHSVTFFLILLFFVQPVQAKPFRQVATSAISIYAQIDVDATNGFPRAESRLEITAPETFPYFVAFQNETPGSIEYRQAMSVLFLAIGLDPSPELINAKSKGPTGVGSGNAVFIISLSDTFDSLDNTLSILPPFQMRVDNNIPHFIFTPQSIKAEIPLVAELNLHGFDADNAGYARYGTVIFPSSTEMTARWKLPAESYHQGEEIEVPFLYSTLEQLIRETYKIPLDQSVKIQTSVIIEKNDSLTRTASIITRLEILAPRQWPFIDSLRPNSLQQPTDQSRFKAFLNTLKYWNPDELESLINGTLLLSHFSIAENVVHATLSSSRMGFNPLFLKGQDRQGLLDGIYIEAVGNNTRIFLNSGSSRPYNWLTQTAEIEVKGFQIFAVTPMPNIDDGSGKLTWEIQNGKSTDEGSDIAITIDTKATTFMNRVFSGFLDPYSIITTINFILSLVFIFFLFRILSPRRRDLRSYFPPDAVRLVQILYPLVVVLVILQLLFGSRSLFSSFFLSQFAASAPRQLMEKANKIAFSLEQTYGLYSILALVIFTLTAAWQTRHSKKIKQWILWLSGISLGTLLAFPFGYSLTKLIVSDRFTMFQTDLSASLQDLLLNPSFEFLPKIFDSVLLVIYTILIIGFTSFILTGLGQLLVAMMQGVSLKQVAAKFNLTRKMGNWTVFLLALAICFQWGYVYFHQMNGVDWIFKQAIDSVIKDYTSNFASQVFTMLPLFMLVGIGVILYHTGMSELSPIIPTKLHWCIALVSLTFARFVSNVNLSVASLSFPLGLVIMFWALPRLLNNKLDSIPEWIENNFPSFDKDSKPILSVYRKEFLERAKAMEDLEAQNQKAYSDYTKNTLDLDAYHKQQMDIKNQLEWIKHGGTNRIRSAKNQFQKIKAKTLFPLPDFISPKDLALSLGPRENWWQNGVLAARFGLVLSILPVGYHIYVLLLSRAKIILSSGTFGVTYIFNDVLFEIAFWLVAAFSMGMLYPYLWGRNGVMKGAFLAGIYGMVIGVVALLQIWVDQGVRTSWIFSTLQLLLFWTVLGVLMDWSSLKNCNLYWREIIDLYNLQDTRVLVGYLSPLALSVLGIVQQVVSGAASNSIITEVIKSLGNALPNLP